MDNLKILNERSPKVIKNNTLSLCKPDMTSSYLRFKLAFNKRNNNNENCTDNNLKTVNNEAYPRNQIVNSDIYLHNLDFKTLTLKNSIDNKTESYTNSSYLSNVNKIKDISSLPNDFFTNFNKNKDQNTVITNRRNNKKYSKYIEYNKFNCDSIFTGSIRNKSAQDKILHKLDLLTSPIHFNKSSNFNTILTLSDIKTKKTLIKSMNINNDISTSTKRLFSDHSNLNKYSFDFSFTVNDLINKNLNLVPVKSRFKNSLDISSDKIGKTYNNIILNKLSKTKSLTSNKKDERKLEKKISKAPNNLNLSTNIRKLKIKDNNNNTQTHSNLTSINSKHTCDNTKTRNISNVIISKSVYIRKVVKSCFSISSLLNSNTNIYKKSHKNLNLKNQWENSSISNFKSKEPNEIKKLEVSIISKNKNKNKVIPNYFLSLNKFKSDIPKQINSCEIVNQLNDKDYELKKESPMGIFKKIRTLNLEPINTDEDTKASITKIETNTNKNFSKSSVFSNLTKIDFNKINKPDSIKNRIPSKPFKNNFALNLNKILPKSIKKNQTKEKELSNKFSKTNYNNKTNLKTNSTTITKNKNETKIVSNKNDILNKTYERLSNFKKNNNMKHFLQKVTKNNKTNYNNQKPEIFFHNYLNKGIPMFMKNFNNNERSNIEQNDTNQNKLKIINDKSYEEEKFF